MEIRYPPLAGARAGKDDSFTRKGGATALSRGATSGKFPVRRGKQSPQIAGCVVSARVYVTFR